MLLEGIIHYYKNVESVRHFYNSGFFFDDCYVAEKGFKNRPDTYYSFFIGYKDGNKVDFVTNEPTLSLTFHNGLDSLSESEVAIAAWFDKSSKHFSLSRELFGKIPLFYIHIPDEFFAFSTSVTRLIEFEDVKPHLAIDPSTIVSYIEMSGSNYTDNASSTFYAKIKCVLPGHLIEVNRQSVSTKPFVQLKPGKWAHLATPTEYNEELARLFKGSISYASRDSIVMGSHLSGGLDSSSVSSVLRYLYPDKAIHTFHIPSTSAEADERAYAEAVAADIRSQQHLIDHADDNLASLRLATEIYGQPENGFLSPATNHKTLRTAQSLGCDVLLNGFGGDSVIGDGLDLVIQSFHQKDYDLFQELLKKRVRYFSRKRLHASWDNYDFDKQYHLVLQNALYRRFSASSRSFSQLLQLYKEVSPRVNISLTYFLGRALKSLMLRKAGRNTKQPGSIIRDDIQTDLSTTSPNFPKSLRGNLPDHFQELFNDVFHPEVIRKQEQDFILSCHYGVSNRAPFMNKELLELNMAIPDILKFGDGIGRAHFREAMKGILIDKVRNRGDKSTVSSSEGEKMALDLYHESHEYLNDSQKVWMYVDRAKFQEQVKIALNNKIPIWQKSATYALITRTISLSVWLNWLKNKGY